VFRLEDLDGKTLKLSEADAPVLAYNYGEIVRDDAPKRDHRRRRSCYIHPVWGVHGEVLTDDFPDDHYHHHGVFWAWPYVAVGEGKRKPYNGWTGSKLRQEFARWVARQAGTTSGLIAAEERWTVPPAKDKRRDDSTVKEDRRSILTHRVWITAYREVDGNRAIDLRLVLEPTDAPITLWGRGGKSYGGLTVRFIGEPHKDQVITVPSGRTKDDLKIASLEWVDFTRHFAGAPERSGGTVMIHPEHPDYPPTWLTRHYGPLCVGWPGVQEQTIQPGKPVTLRYRLWVHGKELEPEQIAEAYAAYKAAAEATWE
jgi:hypothetical protein